jgi:hypothetical protein
MQRSSLEPGDAHPSRGPRGAGANAMPSRETTLPSSAAVCNAGERAFALYERPRQRGRVTPLEITNIRPE